MATILSNDIFEIPIPFPYPNPNHQNPGSTINIDFHVWKHYSSSDIYNSTSKHAFHYYFIRQNCTEYSCTSYDTSNIFGEIIHDFEPENPSGYNPTVDFVISRRIRIPESIEPGMYALGVKIYKYTSMTQHDEAHMNTEHPVLDGLFNNHLNIVSSIANTYITGYETTPHNPVPEGNYVHVITNGMTSSTDTHQYYLYTQVRKSDDHSIIYRRLVPITRNLNTWSTDVYFMLDPGFYDVKLKLYDRVQLTDTEISSETVPDYVAALDEYPLNDWDLNSIWVQGVSGGGTGTTEEVQITSANVTPNKTTPGGIVSINISGIVRGRRGEPYNYKIGAMIQSRGIGLVVPSNLVSLSGIMPVDRDSVNFNKQVHIRLPSRAEIGWYDLKVCVFRPEDVTGGYFDTTAPTVSCYPSSDTLAPRMLEVEQSMWSYITPEYLIGAGIALAGIYILEKEKNKRKRGV